MEQIKQVIICGFGGQGIVLAGTMLGQAAFNDGKWVSSTNSYGAAARGGSCRSEVVISNKPITFPRVIEADILITMYQSAYDKFIGWVREGAVVIYDERFVSPVENKSIKYFGIPATKTAIELFGSEMYANVIILGAAVEITKVAKNTSLIQSVSQLVPEKLKELDLNAINIGFELVRKKISEYANVGDQTKCQ